MTGRVRIWRRSLVARLVCTFLLLSLVTVLLLGQIAFFQLRRALQDSILDRLSVAATLKEDVLSRWLDGQTRDFLSLCQLPPIQAQLATLLEHEGSEIEREAVFHTTSSAIRGRSEWQEILFLADDGEVVVSTDPSREGDYRILDRYFIEGRKDTFVQKVYPSPVTFKPTITIATPVLGGERQRGVMALHLNLERMDEIILERTGLGVSSESYLVDPFNVLISGKRFGQDEYPRGVRSDGIEAALAGRDGAGLYTSFKNVPVIGVYRWIEDFEVALLTEMPQREAFAPARRLAATIFVVGLAVAVALTVGIYLLARQIARPVLSLTRTAVEVAGGDLTAQAPILTDDEVGVLGRTFNHMTARLRALYEDLETEIAEKKRAQSEREALIDELEAKNAELERFAYTVSHDLKSPLVTTQGFLGLLEKDLAAADAARVAHDVERLRAAAGTMHRLLDDLLELSRIGRLVNPPEAVKLDELVREALDLVAGRLAESGIEIEIEPDLPAVWGDRVRLLEVWQNLIENAVKAVRSRPRPRIEIGAREVGGEVLCHVRDNGKGIDPRYHEKIFGLFDQLEPSDEGTGIGLTLVRRIVEVHGGEIRVESELDAGAAFYFTLPRPVSV